MSAELPAGYRVEVLRHPLLQPLREPLGRLLGHKGEPWLRDIRWRAAHARGDLSSVGFAGDEPVAHAWLGRAEQFPEAALLGHVYTVEAHRGQGLATRVLGNLFAEFDRTGGRWAMLGTLNPAAVRIYERLGFAPLNGGMEEENLQMVRPGDPDAVRREFFDGDGPWEAVPFERAHYPSACLLLNLDPAPDKVQACDVNRGLKSELRLLEGIEAQERGERRLGVLIDRGKGRVRGFGCARGSAAQVFAPGVPEGEREALLDMLRRGD